MLRKKQLVGSHTQSLAAILLHQNSGSSVDRVALPVKKHINKV
jgi:hypothetical protein